MHSYFNLGQYDLVTPDGFITSIKKSTGGHYTVEVTIENILPTFRGYVLEPEFVVFNLKSTLAQLGIEGKSIEIQLEPKIRTAYVKVDLHAIGQLASMLLELLVPGAYIGKLFAADEMRRVREPEYLLRMLGRSDKDGSPLLSLGGLQGSDLLSLEKIEGRTVAFLSLQRGVLTYDKDITSFFPTLAKALMHADFPVRDFLHLHQKWNEDAPKVLKDNEVLLVRTLPLHIRTVFGKVVDSLLPKGFEHTTASVLQPDTMASGDIYELYGKSEKEIDFIPLEFYTLEPYREYVFFSDRDQLQNKLEDEQVIFKTLEDAPSPKNFRASVFIVKGSQLQNLTEKDWVVRDTHSTDLPGLIHPARQALLIQHYIEQQPTYPFLKAMEDGIITSQGVLFSRYFPSPLMKRLFLNDVVQNCLKRFYFSIPSRSNGQYFSHEDRSFLLDLAKFAIPVYWADQVTGKVLQYVPKPNKDAGMFVPLASVDTFSRATFFGLYGSCLVTGNFENELTTLMQGLLDMRTHIRHPLLNANTPLAMVTGGGPGVMEVGNRVAKKLGILSCANFVDFRYKKDAEFIEQGQNPYIEAKMTYRIDRLVERQAEFFLDFPIFLQGGIGTDFEFSLELVRRKTLAVGASPILLFGQPEYWRKKITSIYQCNLETGTIAGSEWTSNCFFCIQTAAQGLKIYHQYFNNTLPIGPGAPINKDGFIIVA